MQHQYNLSRDEINRGWKCAGERCSGWVLSPFDTWERCGCLAPGKHPMEEEWEQDVARWAEADMWEDERNGTWDLEGVSTYPYKKEKVDDLPF